MAKGAFLSVKRGKLGDSIGYNVSNSNNKERQGWRIYQPVVKNPQTDGQMVQRVKLAAVNNLYRSLKEVIKRGFEGKEYGDPSRRAWLRLALGQDFTAGPWLTKGSQVPVPIKQVPLTVGSLAPITVRWAVDEGLLLTSIRITGDSVDITTIADLSTMFINQGYQSGDQVTFIFGWQPTEGAFTWRVVSFYIDVTDTRDFVTVLGLTIGNDGGDVYFGLNGVQRVDAYAVAVSRDGDGVYLRSTSYLGVNPVVDVMYYGPAMYVAARLSYLKTAAKDTNWPIQPTRGGGDASYTTVAADGTPITLAGVDSNMNYVQVLADTGEGYYVKCTDVTSTSYNKWLKQKATSAAQMWVSAAPTDPAPPNDSVVNFDAGNRSTEDGRNLYYFLLSQGFDSRALLGLGE